MALLTNAVVLLAFISLSLAHLPIVVKVTNSHFLGNITSTNSNTIRDLGFHGTVGGWHINTYGDTFHCNQMNAHSRSGCNVPLGANSASYSTSDPLRVTDFNLHGADNDPYQFCAFDNTEVPNYDWGMGITNVHETGTNKGILFFARNYRPGAGTLPGAHLTGSGVAVVNVSGDYPTCTRTATQWWNASEPVWGDHGAVDGNDGYIYAFGQLGSDMALYLTRVRKSEATTQSAYQYWQGGKKGFTRDRIFNGTTRNGGQIVVTGVNQGSVLWSPFFKSWVFVSRKEWDLVAITIRTAPHLSGPWSNETTIFRAPVRTGNYIYAPVVHPHYDKSGKSMIISYTQIGNIQQACKVIFKNPL